uniref:Uncharacterized protein n=1 Tax=Hyaloperonospora arabidopsidis (strain Emoy2) TaxID=559515 RepID=M4B9D1_HYAAE
MTCPTKFKSVPLFRLGVEATSLRRLTTRIIINTIDIQRVATSCSVFSAVTLRNASSRKRSRCLVDC